MKISPDTLSILKNFSTINRGILITPGNVIQTRTTAVYARATIKEEFPLEVGIYDLNNFLNVVSLFNDPDFEFANQCLRIAESDGRAETQYGYAGAELVQLSTKKKKMELPAQTIDFILSEEEWNKIQKAVSVLQKPEIKVTSDGTTVRLSTENHQQPGSNSYSLVVDAEPHGYKCNMIFLWSNVKLMKGGYEVSVTPHFAQFKHKEFDLIYMIGAEPTQSTFEE